jgi:hypothetical protein
VEEVLPGTHEGQSLVVPIPVGRVVVEFAGLDVVDVTGLDVLLVVVAADVAASAWPPPPRPVNVIAVAAAAAVTVAPSPRKRLSPMKVPLAVE